MYDTALSKSSAFEFKDPFSADQFVVCSLSRHIFCRPNCDMGIKKYRRQDLRFLSSPEEAIGEGFAPCKYCFSDRQTEGLDYHNGTHVMVDIDLLISTVIHVNKEIGFIPPLLTEESSKTNMLKRLIAQSTSSRLKRKLLPAMSSNKKGISSKQNKLTAESVNLTKNEFDRLKLIDMACRHIALAASSTVREVSVPSYELKNSSSLKNRRRRGGVLGFKELAAKSNLSPWHFHRVFKNVTGLTPKNYGDRCCAFIKTHAKNLPGRRVVVIYTRIANPTLANEEEHEHNQLLQRNRRQQQQQQQQHQQQERYVKRRRMSMPLSLKFGSAEARNVCTIPLKSQSVSTATSSPTYSVGSPVYSSMGSATTARSGIELEKGPQPDWPPTDDMAFASLQGYRRMGSMTSAGSLEDIVSFDSFDSQGLDRRGSVVTDGMYSPPDALEISSTGRSMRHSPLSAIGTDQDYGYPEQMYHLQSEGQKESSYFNLAPAPGDFPELLDSSIQSVDTINTSANFAELLAIAPHSEGESAATNTGDMQTIEEQLDEIANQQQQQQQQQQQFQQVQQSQLQMQLPSSQPLQGVIEDVGDWSDAPRSEIDGWGRKEKYSGDYNNRNNEVSRVASVYTAM